MEEFHVVLFNVSLTNGSAKLKQIKLDVRREQWLSRVKKECTADSNGRVDHCPSSKHIAREENESPNKEIRRKRGEDIEDSCIQGNSLGSMTTVSIQSSFDNDESGNSFSGGSSSSGSMRTSFSGNVSEEEEEEDDGCLDDWEAVADALNADSVVSESPAEHESLFIDSVPVIAKSPGLDFSKTKFVSAVPESHPNCHAWKPNDSLRPQCLPDLSKQHSSPLNPAWHGHKKTGPWAWQTIISQPSQCPICYEDLDVTDSSFLPCPCGFRLCLFCHKKILEADGRCPGCRKIYDHHVDGNGGFGVRAKAFHITQPCSMRTSFTVCSILKFDLCALQLMKYLVLARPHQSSLEIYWLILNVLVNCG
ncbi:hypothetical protein RIF29_18882 [Crotalaria pallida]|uniref:RING-type domain-containing protein n=1 Tax=Crotalaria pallida TaxID=3830 RepID=A0AAN9F0R6_CROPI